MRRVVVTAIAVVSLVAAARAAPPSSARTMALGVNTSLGGVRVLAPDSAWNTPIDHLPPDPTSATLIGSIGADAPLHPDFGTTWNKAPWGIPYVVVSGDTPRYPVRFEYAGESDDVLYPIPVKPPIEGLPAGVLPQDDKGDRHLIVIDRDHGRLYELFAARYVDGGWRAGCGAVFDLFGDTQRPRGWTSADAAGLPIFPGLVRYDEAVEQGRIDHALRFTAPRTRRAFIGPASHYASKNEDPALPPMGTRLRLKANVDEKAYPTRVRPILVALKRYGMILADNGGALFLSGAPDPRWNDHEIDLLKSIRGRDFEVVRMSTPVGP